uniref:RING-type domain-containing protein n=1 Tax=Opuntia streptacantha TaxID=393608 RepID=A0A7C9DLL1_OPUST
MDSHYIGSATPYNSAGSFIDFVAGLTYDHVNFIFAGSSPMQDSAYSPVSMGHYKYGYSESAATQYYSDSQSYEIYDHNAGIDEYSRTVSDFPSNDQTTMTNQQSERSSNTNVNTSNRDCPRSHHSSVDYQAIWHDYIDPDSMSYEELLELGETVGTQSRGLSQEQIALLPVSKFKTSILLRKKSRSERCVICQMEYKRGDRLITLPCKHKYHVSCGTKWLSINKACPICYTDVVVPPRSFK